MKRTISSVAAFALAAGVGLSAVAPAEAAPSRAAGQTKTRPVKQDQAARKLAIAKRQLTMAVVVRDAQLGKVVRENRVSTLPLASRTAVVANVAGDRAALKELRSLVQAATTLSALVPLKARLATVRPANYAYAVNAVRQAARLQALVDANAELVVGNDDATLANDEAATAVASALELALAVTAASPKADLHAVQAELVAAKEALVAVEDALLAAEEPVEEPTEDPTDDPTDDPTEDPALEPVV